MTERDQQRTFHSEFEYHRREWAVQRAGWVVIAVVLAAALAGVFGSGPLSQTRVQTHSHRIEYERFAHYGARTALIVTASRDTSASRDLPIQIDHAFIDAYHIEAITPEPKQTTDTGEAVTFVFDAASTARIVFRLEPDRIGRHAGEVRIDSESESARLSQFVYP